MLVTAVFTRPCPVPVTAVSTRPCPVPLHLLCFVLLAFPTLIVRTQGELVLNAEKPQLVLVWDHMFTVCSGKDKFQIELLCHVG